MQVAFSLSSIFVNSLFSGEKVLIDDAPRIQNRFIPASYLMPRTSSFCRLPSHKFLEPWRKLIFLPSEIRKTKFLPPQKIRASDIPCREYNRPAHALLKTALSSIYTNSFS